VTTIQTPVVNPRGVSFAPRGVTRGKLSSHGRRIGSMLEKVLKPFEAVALEPLASLSPSTKLIWCYLATEGGLVVAGNRTLCAILKLANKSVVDGVDQLETLGLLEIVERGSGQKPRVVLALYPQKPKKESSHG
jgi:hypothetical protein